MSDELAKLAKLREPFPPHQISKLPKPTKQQTEAIKQDFRKGIRCKVCGAWHHPDVVHLDYVGHAALTDRLLDVDPCWSWEPVAWDDNGLPRFDGNGGLWIRLTVCGVTRLGYGHADGKVGGDAIKEAIGDCLITGTVITTARGDLPIECVEVGDMVPTRFGWKPVTDHWLSSSDAPVVKITLSDGRTITGTPHHKVPTMDGVKRLSALRTGDTMHGWQGIESYQEPRKSYGADDATVGIRRTDLSTGSGISWQQLRRAHIFTGTSMSHPGEQSRMAGMSITKTVIGTITAMKTSLLSIRESIQATTGYRVKHHSKHAMSVVESSLPHLTGLNGALLPARNDGGGAPEWPMSSRLLRQSFVTRNAMSAGQTSNSQSHGHAFAPVSVVGVSDAGRGEVWNLSVGDVHEYVANGILVYNSLRNAAMRFGAALDLWHKGDLHAPAENGEDESEDGASASALTPEEHKMLRNLIAAAEAGPQALQMAFTAIPKSEAKARVWAAHRDRLKAIADEHRQPAPGDDHAPAD